MSRNILLVDTNFSALPIFKYLESKASKVFVIGGNPNDALAKSSVNYIQQDYSDVDTVKSIIKDYDIAYLVPGGNDFSYKICSEINKDNCYFNIDSPEINETLNNKEKFRKFALKHSLHVPAIFEPAEVTIETPVIVKPVDAYSGHGITVLQKPKNNSLYSAIEYAKEFSKGNNCVVEEFVDGQLYSHSAFIENGEIRIDFIVEEHCIVNKFVVDTSWVIHNFHAEILDSLRNDIRCLAKELELSDGLIHTQFISDGKDFWIIEITRRCPGDLYSRLIEDSTSFPYAEYYARPFLNEKVSPVDFKLETHKLIRHTMTVADNNTIFNSLKFKLPLDKLEYIPLSVTGDKLKASPFSRIGLLFIEAKEETDYRLLLKSAKNRTLYTVE